MPLTPTERRSLAVASAPAITKPFRAYVVFQRSVNCPVKHATGVILDTPPSCGKCTVKIATNATQAQALSDQATAAARDYAQEQSRATFRTATDGSKVVNWKREGTDLNDQDDVVAAYAAVTQAEVRKYADGRGDVEFVADPLHVSDLGRYDSSPIRRVYIDGVEFAGTVVDTNGAAAWKMPYWLVNVDDLIGTACCKYCNKPFAEANYIPEAREHMSQSFVIDVLSHYYACTSIRKFQTIAQVAANREAGRDLRKEPGVPMACYTLSGSDYCSVTVELVNA